MRAYVLREIGKFQLEEAEMPEAGPGEVIVAVRAAGICGSDIPRIYYSGTYSYPLIPGHEFSGVVSSVGPGVPEKYLGKRVGVFPLIPCGRCIPCQQKKYEMCRKYSYLGSRQDGGFAEFVRVPEWNLIELPDGVSLRQAAMMEPMAVAVHAMRRTEIKKEDRVAICGLGTIGLLLLMFLREKGVKDILAIGNKEIQRKKALEFGLKEECYFDNRSGSAGEWLAEKSQDKGIDVFFDCVGRNEAVTLAVDYTAPGGNVVCVGNPASDITLEKTTYWKILRNQLRVNGTWNSSFLHDVSDDWHYVMSRLECGRIKPELLITQQYEFSDLLSGFELMRDKKKEYVKVMGEITS